MSIPYACGTGEHLATEPYCLSPRTSVAAAIFTYGKAELVLNAEKNSNRNLPACFSAGRPVPLTPWTAPPRPTPPTAPSPRTEAAVGRRAEGRVVRRAARSVPNPPIGCDVTSRDMPSQFRRRVRRVTASPPRPPGPASAEPPRPAGCPKVQGKQVQKEFDKDQGLAMRVFYAERLRRVTPKNLDVLGRNVSLGPKEFPWKPT